MPKVPMPRKPWWQSKLSSTISSVKVSEVKSTAMLSLHGLAASRGYAIGRAVVLSAAALEVSHYRVAAEDIEAECQRLSSAIDVARVEFVRLADQLPDDAPREIQALLHV